MHEIIVNEVTIHDNQILVDLSITKEFKTWFVENQSLKKWSHKRFQKVFLNAFDPHVPVEFGSTKTKISVNVV